MEDSAKTPRLHVLEMIENGRISVDEGLSLLQSLDEDADVSAEASEAPAVGRVAAAVIDLDQPEAQAGTGAAGDRMDAGDGEGAPATLAGAPDEKFSESIPTPEEKSAPSQTPAEARSIPADIAKWRRWWMLPFWIGVAITIFGGLVIFWTLKVSGLNLWFACASLPFTLGVVVMILAWSSRTAPWIHLRIRQKAGESPQKIALSFPIPVGVTAWFLRVFGNRIPRFQDTSLDEVVLAVSQHTSPDTPIFIQVDEADGEHVEVYIG